MTYIRCSSEFAWYPEEYLLYKHHTFGLWVSMTQSWSDFTLTFTSAFLLEIITWVPFFLGSWNLLCYIICTDLNLQLCLDLPLGHAHLSFNLFVHFSSSPIKLFDTDFSAPMRAHLQTLYTPGEGWLKYILYKKTWCRDLFGLLVSIFPFSHLSI